MPWGWSFGREQRHEVDHVDEPHRRSGTCSRSSHARPASPWVGMSPAQASTTSGSSLGRSVPGPAPRSTPRRAVRGRRLEVEVLELRLLVDHDEVHVVVAAEAVVGHREQAVGVRRQVDAGHLALLGAHGVDQARALVAEAVVVVAPAGRGQQDVERRDRPPPRQSSGAASSHLVCCTSHRGRDHRERLVGGEQPVAAGQHVALEPALAEVLAQHLHHPAVGRDVVVDGERSGSTQAAVRRPRTPRRAGWSWSRRGRTAGSRPRRRCGAIDVAQQLAERAGRLVRAPCPGWSTATA